MENRTSLSLFCDFFHSIRFKVNKDWGKALSLFFIFAYFVYPLLPMDLRLRMYKSRAKSFTFAQNNHVL